MRHDDEVQLYAFDLLALTGDDLRSLTLSMRKANLERLLARWLEGIFVIRSSAARSAPICFAPPTGWVLEGLVSKRRDRPYQAGRSKHWVKIKNRSHPAMSRVMESFG
jgi:bifunctional non-homologous end joining protein LigD